jgi:thiamine biosynthesis lipoprotein
MKDILLAGIGCCSMLLSACNLNNGNTDINGLITGNGYRIALNPRDYKGEIDRFEENIKKIIHDIDSKLFDGGEYSEIAGFNRSRTTEWVSVSPEIVMLVNLGKQVYERSEGCFDLSARPIIELWDGASREERTPRQEEVDRVLAHVGMSQVEIDPENHRIRKQDPEIQIDLSPLATGYKISSIASFLEREGIQNYWIKLDNEIKVKGHKADGKAWRVAIDAMKPTKPFTLDEVTLLKKRELEGVSLVATGDYHPFSRVGAQSDILVFNPKTGRPVSNYLRHVAVLDEDPVWAAAWNSTLLCLGEKEAAKVAQVEQLGALLIYEERFDFDQYRSKAFLTAIKRL